MYENVYRSLVYHMTTIVPDTVFVVEGESYGIDLDDGSGKSPAVTVTLDEMHSDAFEMGSMGSTFGVKYTITAKSRVQRDALKQLVYSGLLYHPIYIYDSFDEYVPASGASITYPAQFDENIYITDTPNFSSDREKFFWTSVVLTDLHIL